MRAVKGSEETTFLVTLWTYGGRRVFADPRAAALFCRVLGGLRQRLGFRLHAYVLLPDRIRLIFGARGGDPLWAQITVQRLKSRFARELNARRGRLEMVWQDADQRLALVSGEDVRRRAEFLHRVPVMARLARHPAEWRWSSYRAWAGCGRVPVPIDPPRRVTDGAATLGGGPLSG